MQWGLSTWDMALFVVVPTTGDQQRCKSCFFVSLLLLSIVSMLSRLGRKVGGVPPGAAGKWGLAEAAVSWEADDGDTSNTFHIPVPAASILHIAQHDK